MRNYILLILAVFILAGCQSDGTKEDAAGNVPTDAVETGKLGEDGQPLTTAFSAGEEPYRKDAINDATSPLSQKVIYFDFNASTIKDEYRDLITWHGRYLASNADMKLRLEGHTDERGSREYNIALADSRALAVSRMLMFQGAAKKQIEVISYGEEKPVALEHNEEAWSKNRRVQLVYEAM